MPPLFLLALLRLIAPRLLVPETMWYVLRVRTLEPNSGVYNTLRSPAPVTLFLHPHSRMIIESVSGDGGSGSHVFNVSPDDFI